MSSNIDRLHQAERRAQAVCPKVGGFPHLAECLRQAGVTQNIWQLPACQSIFVFDGEAVVVPMPPLIADTTEVPRFDEAALVRALRLDQAGEGTFQEFLARSWQAGVVSYRVDLKARTVTYEGAAGERYVEAYSAVTLPD